MIWFDRKLTKQYNSAYSTSWHFRDSNTSYVSANSCALSILPPCNAAETGLRVAEIGDMNGPEKLVSVLQNIKRNQRTIKKDDPDNKSRYEQINQAWEKCDWSCLKESKVI